MRASAPVKASDPPMIGLGEIAEQIRRSTVLVLAGARGNGSGVIWPGDGTIVTNAHVARESNLRVQLWDGRELSASVISRDARRDLAQLQVSALGLVPAVPGDSSQVRPGELAIAIGNPLGFVGALTTGVIHGVGSIRGLGAQSWIQATVRLAPGNSGGPLADAQGRVIGINTMVAGHLGLAIPSNAVGSFLSRGASDAWLGVTVHPVGLPRLKELEGSRRFGLVVLEIDAGSPASLASLLPGDILLGAEERFFASIDDLSQALQGSGPRLLRLEFLRGDYGRIRRVTVQLGNSLGAKGSVAA